MQEEGGGGDKEEGGGGGDEEGGGGGHKTVCGKGSVRPARIDRSTLLSLLKAKFEPAIFQPEGRNLKILGC